MARTRNDHRTEDVGRGVVVREILTVLGSSGITEEQAAAMYDNLGVRSKQDLEEVDKEMMDRINVLPVVAAKAVKAIKANFASVKAPSNGIRLPSDLPTF